MRLLANGVRIGYRVINIIVAASILVNACSLRTRSVGEYNHSIY